MASLLTEDEQAIQYVPPFHSRVSTTPYQKADMAKVRRRRSTVNRNFNPELSMLIVTYVHRTSLSSMRG